MDTSEQIDSILSLIHEWLSHIDFLPTYLISSD
jgi:hypothetical protein